MTILIKNIKTLYSLSKNERDRKAIKKLINITKKILEISQPANFLQQKVKFNSDKLILNDKVILSFSDYSKYKLIALGKASVPMSRWFLSNFKRPIDEVIISSPTTDIELMNNSSVSFFTGSHPFPNEQSVLAAKRALKILEKSSSNELFFILISGGGSSLFEVPDFNITLDDYNRMMKILLSSGANIAEINTIRKHLSKVKGGKLVRNTKARIISLIISDVPHNNICTIAAGPTCVDDSTWKDCERIIKKYDIEEVIPSSIRDIIVTKSNNITKDKEKNQRTNNSLKNVTNFVVGSNEDVLKTLRDSLVNNYNLPAYIINSAIEGDSAQTGKKLIELIKQKLNLTDSEKKIEGFFLFGGETTVTIDNKLEKIGKGGRNQELALSFAISNRSSENVYLVQLGTDGIDGNSKAAGALVGPFTITDEKRHKDAEKALKYHDTNGFFHKYGGEIITGYTGTNVMDITTILIEKILN